MKIAFVGNSAVGKDTLSQYVEKTYGIPHVSSGDLIRAYIKEHSLGGLERENLQKVGNELREKHGPAHLVRLALARFPERLVLSGLRAVPEVEAFQQAGGKVVWVEAPVEKRYEFAKMRGGIDDRVSFETFKRAEEVEYRNANNNAQNLLAVKELADWTIYNDGSVEDLFAKVRDLFSDQHGELVKSVHIH